jgi:hypothetical protein
MAVTIYDGMELNDALHWFHHCRLSAVITVERGDV